MMLATIRPGPVLHIWRDGAELARDILAALPSYPAFRKGNDHG